MSARASRTTTLALSLIAAALALAALSGFSRGSTWGAVLAAAALGVAALLGLLKVMALVTS
jgi:hypothetical protein